MALTLALAACGGDEALSADDYSSQLDAACAEVMQANRELPQIQADEELSIEEVEELAEENGDEFIAKVRDLTPPDDLADVHEDLVEGIEKGPPEDDLDAYLAYQEEGAALLRRARCDRVRRRDPGVERGARGSPRERRPAGQP